MLISFSYVCSYSLCFLSIFCQELGLKAYGGLNHILLNCSSISAFIQLLRQIVVCNINLNT